MSPQPKTGAPLSSEDVGAGWALWSGGENPHPGQVVEVRLRNGFEGFTPSDKKDWLHSPRRNDALDIIAFRLPDHISSAGEKVEPANGEVAAAVESGADYATLADLHTIKGWLHGLSTYPDLNEIAADGGVTVGMTYQQDAREFAGRIDRILTALRAQPNGGAK